MTRWKLRRQETTVETPYGVVGAKVAFRGDVVMNVAPEVRDCRRLAVEQGVPLKDVYQAAQQAARAQIGESGQGSGGASEPGVGSVRS
jgi:uncharacterized protein (DUF111 family)